MDMSLFDTATPAKSIRGGQRDHRNKDHDRNSDDFKSLRKANRRERPRERFIRDEEDEE